VHDVRVVTGDVDEAAHRHVDAAALAVLGHFVRVVAAAVPEEPGAVPVADALVVDVAQVAVVAVVVDDHRDPARPVDPARPDREALREGLVAVGEERRVQVDAAGLVDLVAAAVDAEGDAARAREGLRVGPRGEAVVVEETDLDGLLRALVRGGDGALLHGIVEQDRDAEAGGALRVGAPLVHVAAAVVDEDGDAPHRGTERRVTGDVAVVARAEVEKRRDAEDGGPHRHVDVAALVRVVARQVREEADAAARGPEGRPDAAADVAVVAARVDHGRVLAVPHVRLRGTQRDAAVGRVTLERLVLREGGGG